MGRAGGCMISLCRDVLELVWIAVVVCDRGYFVCL